MSARLRLALAVALAAVCGFASAMAQGEGTRLVYRLKKEGGAPAGDQDVANVIRIVAKRLDGAGFAGVTVSSGESAITLGVPSAHSEQLERIRSLVQRNGRLEFRIQAPDWDERHWREMWEKSGHLVNPPPEFQWVKRPEPDKSDMLVLTPERPLLQKAERLRKRKADATEIRAAQVELEEVMRNEVFTGDDLMSTSVQRQTIQIVVQFEVAEARKAQFGEFTGRHVGENLAIILDGRVQMAPVLKSKLPGEGIIEGGGATGFSEQEALDLVTVLKSGALGVALELVSEEKAK